MDLNLQQQNTLTGSSLENTQHNQVYEEEPIGQVDQGNEGISDCYDNYDEDYNDYSLSQPHSQPISKIYTMKDIEVMIQQFVQKKRLICCMDYGHTLMLSAITHFSQEEFDAMIDTNQTGKKMVGYHITYEPTTMNDKCPHCKLQGTLIDNVCGHRFCLRCLFDYLTFSQSTNSIFPLCPQEDCQHYINIRLIQALSVSDPPLKTRLNKLLALKFCDDHPHIRICQNQNCGNIINIAESYESTIYCSCGLQFCIYCKKEPHWPLQCNRLQKWQSEFLQKKPEVFCLSPRRSSDSPNHDDLTLQKFLNSNYSELIQKIEKIKDKNYSLIKFNIFHCDFEEADRKLMEDLKILVIKGLELSLRILIFCSVEPSSFQATQDILYYMDLAINQILNFFRRSFNLLFENKINRFKYEGILQFKSNTREQIIKEKSNFVDLMNQSKKVIKKIKDGEETEVLLHVEYYEALKYLKPIVKYNQRNY